MTNEETGNDDPKEEEAPIYSGGKMEDASDRDALCGSWRTMRTKRQRRMRRRKMSHPMTVMRKMTMTSKMIR